MKQLFEKEEDEIFFDFPYQSPRVEKSMQLDVYVPSLSLAFEYHVCESVYLFPNFFCRESSTT